MFKLRTSPHLSLQIRQLKEQYQHHPSMRQVKLLSLKLQEEKLREGIFYQSIKEKIVTC